jgi:hypothetical protein
VIDIDRARLRSTIASSMLGVCTDPACTTIVFGCGTCVDHDPPRVQPVGSGFDEADGWASISRAAAQLEQTTES